MSCSYCANQVASAIERGTGIPSSGASSTQHCPHCGGFLTAEGVCNNPRCPSKKTRGVGGKSTSGNAPLNVSYSTLDPRPKSRDAMLAWLREHGDRTLGIEVTVPQFAKLCGLGNIDPQHTGGEDRAAIEAAMEYPLPQGDDIKLVTVRPDLDSVGAMAVIQMRMDGHRFTPQELLRIRAIALADKHGRGEWPGARGLPSPDDPPEIESFSGVPAGLARIVGDWKRPLDERVRLMREWIETGTCEGLDEAQRAVMEEQRALVLESKVFAVRVHGLDEGPSGPYPKLTRVEPGMVIEAPVALVQSKHRGGIGLGYCVAPVVIAVNDEFPLGGGETGRKFTIAQFADGYVDMRAVAQELNGREAGWGGSNTIIGSPQGRASTLDPGEVVQIVMRHVVRRMGDSASESEG